MNLRMLDDADELDEFEVRCLRLAPGDVVVLTCKGGICQEAAVRLTQYVEAQVPGHKVLVLADGLQIGVMTPAKD